MEDEGKFGFTERELYLGLRLVLGEDEARLKAAEVIQTLAPDMDWAISEQLLLTLSLGSESGHERVQRMRAFVHEAERDLWIGNHGELAWLKHVADENAAWEQKRDQLRQALQEEGKLPPA